MHFLSPLKFLNLLWPVEAAVGTVLLPAPSMLGKTGPAEGLGHGQQGWEVTWC